VLRANERSTLVVKKNYSYYLFSESNILHLYCSNKIEKITDSNKKNAVVPFLPFRVGHIWAKPLLKKKLFYIFVRN